MYQYGCIPFLYALLLQLIYQWKYALCLKVLISVSTTDDKKLSITVDKNETTEDRSGNIKFSVNNVECTEVSDIVVVNQGKGSGGNCGCSILDLDKTLVNFNKDADSTKVGVTFDGSSIDLCNYTVEVEDGKTWITAETYEHEITISVSENMTALARSGKVYIYVEGTKCSKEISVSQRASLTVDPELPSKGCTGGSVYYFATFTKDTFGNGGTINVNAQTMSSVAALPVFVILQDNHGRESAGYFVGIQDYVGSQHVDLVDLGFDVTQPYTISVKEVYFGNNNYDECLELISGYSGYCCRACKDNIEHKTSSSTQGGGGLQPGI